VIWKLGAHVLVGRTIAPDIANNADADGFEAGSVNAIG
jgi:hypothetical protein